MLISIDYYCTREEEHSYTLSHTIIVWLIVVYINQTIVSYYYDKAAIQRSFAGDIRHSMFVVWVFHTFLLSLSTVQEQCVCVMLGDGWRSCQAGSCVCVLPFFLAAVNQCLRARKRLRKAKLPSSLQMLSVLPLSSFHTQWALTLADILF